MSNLVYSGGDQAILRSGGRARWLVIPDPCEVVFQAKVAAVPDAEGGTYTQIQYHDVTIGAFGDIRPDQMVLITETSDHMVPIEGFRDMRVADIATSTIIPVNESEFVLSTSYYITVIDTYKPLQRVRKGQSVDGRLIFEDLAPIIKGLPSVLFVAAPLGQDGQFSFPNVQGVSLTGGTISYLWSFTDPAYDTGSATSQHPVVTLPHGHQWGHLTITDTNGPTHTQHVRLIVQDPLKPTLALRYIDGVKITRTWQGHHATLRAYRGVALDDLLNDTSVAIISLRAYTTETLDEDPVAFVGYLNKDSAQTSGPNDKTVTFDLSGIWERAASLPMNPIAIRDKASPAYWDEINLPTAQRVTAHILKRYSTITNLCSLNLDDITDTWYGGDMDVNVSSLGDAIRQVTSEINAEILQSPSGELFFRRDLRFEDDDTRDDADVILTLTGRDIVDLRIDTNHLEQTGRIIIGYRGYDTTRTPSQGGKAVAPAVTLGTSSETQTRANQLMRADQSVNDLLLEAAQRVGNLLAYENSNPEIGMEVHNLGSLTPSCFQWVQCNVLPGYNTRGRALFGRALVASVDISYENSAGKETVQMELFPETRGGRALVVAMLVPNVNQLTQYITPPQSAYSGSYPASPTANVPDTNTRRRFNQQDMGGQGNTKPADQAYEDGQRQPKPGHANFAISFKNPNPVNAGFISALGQSYTINLSGSAKIAVGSNLPNINLEHTFPAIWNGALTYQGKDGVYDKWDVVAIFAVGDIYPATYNVKDVDDKCMTVISFTTSGGTETTYQSLSCAGGLISGSGVPSVSVSILGGYGDTDGMTFHFVIRDDTGGSPAQDIYADAFYSWNLDGDGNEVNIQVNPYGGIRIDGSPVTPPLYNPAHVYTITKTGTGSPFSFVFADTDHSDNQNVPLPIDIEGPDAA